MFVADGVGAAATTVPPVSLPASAFQHVAGRVVVAGQRVVTGRAAQVLDIDQRVGACLNCILWSRYRETHRHANITGT